jgi:hypothetical protein
LKLLKYILIAAGLLVCTRVFPRITGEWLSAEMEAGLPKRFSFQAIIEARAINSGGIQFKKYFTQAGLAYSISKRFELSAKYRFASVQEENSNYYLRHRLLVDLNFNYPAGQFRFDYRARYQRNKKTYIENDLDRSPVEHFRNRFEVSCDIAKNRLRPSAFYEVFFALNGHQPKTFDEHRIGTELGYPFATRQSITGGLMYIHERYEADLSGFIFLLTYKITLG